MPPIYTLFANLHHDFSIISAYFRSAALFCLAKSRATLISRSLSEPALDSRTADTCSRRSKSTGFSPLSRISCRRLSSLGHNPFHQSNSCKRTTCIFPSSHKYRNQRRQRSRFSKRSVFLDNFSVILNKLAIACNP